VSGHNPQPASRRDAVLRVLERGPLHRAAIVEALDGQERAVVTALSRLKLCGAVANDARGVWRKVSSDG
jgi:lipoate-protein ligase B